MSESGSKDLWEEFSTLQGTIKKKALKKPHLHEAVAHYRKLANSMEEAELFGQAALCHREAASIYRGLENRHFERRHLLKAAKLFYSAQLQQKSSMGSTLEFGKLMEECYLEVTHGILRHESTSSLFQIVGLTYYELSNRFLSLKEYDKAFIYLKQANRFAQEHLFVQMHILETMCDLIQMIGDQDRDEMLAEAGSIWNSVTKTDGMREQLLKLEARIILLHLQCSNRSIIIQKKPFLTTYEEGKWCDSRRSSVTTQHEFQLFSKFINLIKSGAYLTASEMYQIDLEIMLDAKGKELCTEIIDSLNTVRPENKELDIILSLTDLSELQKRDKMFEWFNGSSK